MKGRHIQRLNLHAPVHEFGDVFSFLLLRLILLLLFFLGLCRLQKFEQEQEQEQEEWFPYSRIRALRANREIGIPRMVQ